MRREFLTVRTSIRNVVVAPGVVALSVVVLGVVVLGVVVLGVVVLGVVVLGVVTVGGTLNLGAASDLPSRFAEPAAAAI
jgi:hypothetical protein